MMVHRKSAGARCPHRRIRWWAKPKTGGITEEPRCRGSTPNQTRVHCTTPLPRSDPEKSFDRNYGKRTVEQRTSAASSAFSKPWPGDLRAFGGDPNVSSEQYICRIVARQYLHRVTTRRCRHATGYLLDHGRIDECSNVSGHPAQIRSEGGQEVRFVSQPETFAKPAAGEAGHDRLKDKPIAAFVPTTTAASNTSTNFERTQMPCGKTKSGVGFWRNPNDIRFTASVYRNPPQREIIASRCCVTWPAE